MSLLMNRDFILKYTGQWTVYLVRACDNSLYCGVTTDVARRFNEHQGNSAKTAKYLRGKQPLTLAWSSEVGTKQQALSIEWKIKQLPKHKKERLCIDGDLMLVGFIGSI